MTSRGCLKTGHNIRTCNDSVALDSKYMSVGGVQGFNLKKNLSEARNISRRERSRSRESSGVSNRGVSRRGVSRGGGRSSATAATTASGPTAAIATARANTGKESSANTTASARATNRGGRPSSQEYDYIPLGIDTFEELIGCCIPCMICNVLC